MYITVAVTIFRVAIGSPSAPQSTGTLPAVVVEIGGQKISKTKRATASITVVDAERTVGSKAEVNIRGNSSAAYPKKPYRLELQDDTGDDLKLPLLGMSRESDWILFPAHTDKTMIRDVLAYELWRQMGYWAPRSRYVELYIRREGNETEPQRHGDTEAEKEKVGNVQRPKLDDQGSRSGYEGVYVLMEKIKRGKERLNIAKLTRSDNSEPKISGGYIFKKDRNDDGERGFFSGTGLLFQFEEPKERDITPEQENYLTNYVNTLEGALLSNDFVQVQQLLDVDSFVDYHWMIELSKNVDGYGYSVFYHKDRNGKLKAGPIWDYDLSFGNPGYAKGYATNGWMWQTMRGHYGWYQRLSDNPDFIQRLIDRWSDLRTNVFATSNVLALIERFDAEIREARVRNDKRWPDNDGTWVRKMDEGGNHESELEYLKHWIEGRLEWIDSQDFPKPAMVVDDVSQRSEVGGQKSDEPEDLIEGNNGREGSGAGGEGSREFAPPRLRSGHKSIRMACLVGKIYYTTDGSDPRLPGGVISPKSSPYTEAIPVTPGLKLFARVRSDYGLWSAPVRYGESGRGVEALNR